MDNKGLLFIPDISGFTNFVTNTEIEHSRHIIQELLEVIINSNNLGLEISEIEGDAILFYKYGDTPDLKEIYSQVRDKAADGVRVADQAVRENPYQAIGIAVGVGALIGFLLARRNGD